MRAGCARRFDRLQVTLADATPKPVQVVGQPGDRGFAVSAVELTATPASGREAPDSLCRQTWQGLARFEPQRLDDTRA